VVFCRHIERSPLWTLAQLTQLEELTLSGDDAHRIMRRLMLSSAVPVLPALLKKLLQDILEEIVCLEIPR